MEKKKEKGESIRGQKDAFPFQSLYMQQHSTP